MQVLPQDTLLAVIAVQQEIVQADLSLDGVMNVVADAAARLTTSDAAVVELLEGDEMVYRAAAGAATPHVGLRLDAAHSLSGLCVTLDQTLVCNDCEVDERVDRQACRVVGARSMLVTPLRHRSTPLGVLKVYSSRCAAFDAVAADTLQLLVGIIAASMHRALEYETLTKRAELDMLTGLANRDQLIRATGARIAQRRPFALVFVDLNDFKRINDEGGHARGDEILQVIAQRLMASLRSCDVAARFGGDEFVIVLDGIHSTAAATTALQRLLQRIHEPISDSICISASAGVAVFPADAETADSLLNIADRRMYAGKRARREM